jgi:hypothetical protein
MITRRMPKEGPDMEIDNRDHLNPPISQGQLTVKQEYANFTVVFDWNKVDNLPKSW